LPYSIGGRSTGQFLGIEIKKVERTQNGIRLYPDGFDSPFVCGSLFRGRFLRHLQECGIEVTGPIIKSTWTKL